MKKSLFLFIFLLFSTQVWSSVRNPFSNRFYLGMNGGAILPGSTNNNYISTGGSGWPKDKYATNSGGDTTFFGLNAGYTWARNTQWLPFYSLGIRYQYVPSTSIKGYIDQYSLPGFRNYNYSYNISLLSFLAAFKFDIVSYGNWMPYGVIGAGMLNYGTSNYTEQALANVTPRVSPGSQRYSANNFTYQLGLGLDYIIQNNLIVNFECDYNYFGELRTGFGVNSPTDTGTNYDNTYLKNELNSSSLFVGLTYYPPL